MRAVNFQGLYDRVSQCLGWTAWYVSTLGVLIGNALHPVTDESLILLCWPLVSGITVRPLVKGMWPVMLAVAAVYAAFATHPDWLDALRQTLAVRRT